MAKYKVGDKITIRQWEDMEKDFGLTSYGAIRTPLYFTKGMKFLCGKTREIDRVNSDGTYLIGSWFISDEVIEAEINQTLVIYKNGTDTIGILKKGGKEIKRAVAKLHPNDTYSFVTGSEIILSRIFGEEPEKETFYNGKAVCLCNDFNEGLYTIGKIYEFKDGFMTDDRGEKRPTDAVHNLEEFNEWSAADWLEIKE